MEQDRTFNPKRLAILKRVPGRQWHALRSFGLSSVCVFLDGPCINRCGFCGGNASGSAQTPAWDAAGLHALISKRPTDARALTLLGNEPAARADLILLLETAAEAGYERIEVQTSGELLARCSLAKAAVDAGASDFSIPVYGGRDLHDRVVGRRGSFALLMKALKNITALGARAHIHTVFSVPTIPGMREAAAIARRFAGRLAVMPLRPKNNVCDGSDWVAPLEEAHRLAEELDADWVRFPLCCPREDPGATLSQALKAYASVMNTTPLPWCHGCGRRSSCPGVFVRYEELHGNNGLIHFHR